MSIALRKQPFYLTLKSKEEQCLFPKLSRVICPSDVSSVQGGVLSMLLFNLLYCVLKFSVWNSAIEIKLTIIHETLLHVIIITRITYFLVIC